MNDRAVKSGLVIEGLVKEYVPGKLVLRGIDLALPTLSLIHI